MLGGCGVAGVVGDVAVDSLLVEPVDVGHGRELDIFEASPGALTVDEFPFVETVEGLDQRVVVAISCLLYTSPSPRDRQKSRMPSSA